MIYKKLVYLLLFIIAITNITSCVTEKSCNRKYPPKVEVKEVIKYKDTLIYITNYDTILITSNPDTIVKPVFIYKGLANSDTAYKQSKYAEGWAVVKNSELYLSVYDKDTSIIIVVHDTIKLQNKETSVSSTKTEKIYVTAWYDIIARFISGIVFLIILIRVIIMALKSSLL